MDTSEELLYSFVVLIQLLFPSIAHISEYDMQAHRLVFGCILCSSISSFTLIIKPCRVSLVVCVFASLTVGREFASRPGHTKGHHKNGTNCLPAWHTMR